MGISSRQTISPYSTFSVHFKWGQFIVSFWIEKFAHGNAENVSRVSGQFCFVVKFTIYWYEVYTSAEIDSCFHYLRLTYTCSFSPRTNIACFKSSSWPLFLKYHIHSIRMCNECGANHHYWVCFGIVILYYD